jgi:predicted glutamine amidotransferase
MCRLFGMSSAPRRVRATFWLLEAPDSVAAQSRRNPDGSGLGYFDASGVPRVYKAPIAAYEDRGFAREARDVSSATFVAHVRYASTGGLLERNTHPFLQRGRLFAHNGVIEGLERLEAHLGEDFSLVEGDTDSERFFALITRETAEHGGDVTAGIEHAARWIAQHLPVYALNLVLITANQLWALRYPDTHELYLLDRAIGGHHGDRHLDQTGSGGRLRVRSLQLAAAPAVVLASERLDENSRWRALRSGELIHVDPNGRITSRTVLPDAPAFRLSLADLHPQAAASQAA